MRPSPRGEGSWDRLEILVVDVDLKQVVHRDLHLEILFQGGNLGADETPSITFCYSFSCVVKNGFNPCAEQ